MAREAILTAILKDGISGPAKAIHSEMGKLGKVSSGLHGIAGKLTGGLGSLAGSVFSLQGALVGGGLVAAITAMTKAAADDAASQAKLETAIKANAKAAGDYTAIVDATIAAGQKLAFTDDQTRNSLARLVTSTRDVKEATELNAIAMDLARLKGIDLADAANIIGKVHDGNIGILGRYGISVEEGATATEALTAVQAAAAGQAQAFGDSSAGAFARMQDSIGEAAESMGAVLLPIVTAAADFISSQVVPAISGVIGAVSGWVAANRPMMDQLGGFVSGALTDLVTMIQSRVIPAAVEIAGKIGDFARTIAVEAAPILIEFAGKLAAFAEMVISKIIPTVLDLAERVWSNGLNKVFGAFVKVVGAVYEALASLIDWITSNEAIMEGLRVLAELIGKAFGGAADAISFTVDFLGDLGDAISSNKALMGFLAEAGNFIARAFDQAATAIGFVIDAIGAAVSAAQSAIGILSQVAGAIPGVSLLSNLTGQRAGGGPVSSGGTYLVGERGPELLHMGNRSGYISPNAAIGTGSLAPVTIPIVIDGREVARVVDEHLFYDYRVGARGVIGG